MPLPDDSRPFAVLKQNASDFKSGFEDDIKSCLELLDSKLSSLILDPGSTPLKDGSRLSVDIQFTRAKYDIYMNMKNLFEEFDSSWKEQLEEMKNSFLENVEILLAKTKLNETSSQNDSKKSLKSRKEKKETSANTSMSQLLVKAKRLPSSVLNSILYKSSGTDESDTEENGYSENGAASQRKTQESPLRTSFNKTPSPKKTLHKNIEEASYTMEQVENDDDEEEEEEKIEIQEIVSARSKRGRRRRGDEILLEGAKQTPTKRSTAVRTPLKKATTSGRKSILKADSVIESELHTTPSRSTRKRTAGKDTNLGTNDVMECEEIDLDVNPKTPKNVHFSVGLNVEDDLEIYSPEINISRSASRRKTLMPDRADNFADISLTPNIVRAKSKRKTIGGSVMESVPVAPSPKRFKSSRNSTIAAVTEEEEEDADLSRSESSSAGHYTSWILLDDLDGKVPSQPGVYELKVYKAKKSAYIGSCENLRHKLTLHKLGQNSGHKHLDKYLERNKKDVQVRYEIMPSASQAKNEEMKRIKSFVQQYRTTPSYN